MKVKDVLYLILIGQKVNIINHWSGFDYGIYNLNDIDEEILNYNVNSVFAKEKNLIAISVD